MAGFTTSSPSRACSGSEHDFSWAGATRVLLQAAEVMRALRKGQAHAFNVTGDVRGEARIVERAFGLGASALAEVVQLLNNRLEAEAV